MADMTLTEMEVAGKKAEAIRAAMARLTEARRRLALLEKAVELRGKSSAINWSWHPELILWEEQRYGHVHERTTIRIEIPYGVVEQQLVNDVARARREVILLGGPSNV